MFRVTDPQLPGLQASLQLPSLRTEMDVRSVPGTASSKSAALGKDGKAFLGEGSFELCPFRTSQRKCVSLVHMPQHSTRRGQCNHDERGADQCAGRGLLFAASCLGGQMEG